ncbi:MAG: sensor histidine kinase [Pseudomonadota bacterium]
MMPKSLRARLIVIILTPLLIVSIAAAAWQVRNATNRAEDIFDRGLLSAALAISRDVAVSGGDALGPETRNLLGDTSGGEVFYHVFAPDGVFVTGYATPPVAPVEETQDLQQPLYYEAVYQGKTVRVLRFQDVTTVDGVSGIFTITVWQDTKVRSSFVNEVALRANTVIGLLVASVALIVWFGVGLGLRPLLELQGAIAKRNPNELEPIRRDVPVEAQGIVSTLNTLLDRVSRRISSKDEFISNAAHQLRNPIASVLALAEAVQNAPSPAAMKTRSAELVTAARDATHLTNQLLSFERAKGADIAVNGQELDLSEIVHVTIERFKSQNDPLSLTVTVSAPPRPCRILGDEVMLQEALLNLMTNALIHGGPALSALTITLDYDETDARLVIEDDGIGIDPTKHVQAIGRFSQAKAGPGTGLGLPIAARVMENHGGHLTIDASPHGARITLSLPQISRA